MLYTDWSLGKLAFDIISAWNRSQLNLIYACTTFQSFFVSSLHLELEKSNCNIKLASGFNYYLIHIGS